MIREILKVGDKVAAETLESRRGRGTSVRPVVDGSAQVGMVDSSNVVRALARLFGDGRFVERLRDAGYTVYGPPSE